LRPIIKELEYASFTATQTKYAMKQKYFIGVDVSKSKVDIAVLSSTKEVVSEMVVKNEEKALTRFFRMLFKRHNIGKDDILVCCETTGIYNHPLETCCTLGDIFLWVETALKIKKAASDLRGKSDKKDALRIAEYALRYEDKKHRFVPKDAATEKLGDLLKARDTLIEQRVALENQLSESKAMHPERYKTLQDCFKATLKTIGKELAKLEGEIDALIKKDESVKKNMELLTSIPGIGRQNALNFILHTNNFKNFESANHLACYAGVVPFPNQSGISIRKDRVSKLANHKLKKLLHMAAMACIRAHGELKAYYQRKVKEGKNKMSVINAMRNKLAHRIFAVIKRQTPYINPIGDPAIIAGS